jgi:hypothetical protein
MNYLATHQPFIAHKGQRFKQTEGSLEGRIMFRKTQEEATPSDHMGKSVTMTRGLSRKVGEITYSNIRIICENSGEPYSTHPTSPTNYKNHYKKKQGLKPSISASRALPHPPLQVYRLRCLREHSRHSRRQAEGWDGDWDKERRPRRPPFNVRTIAMILWQKDSGASCGDGAWNTCTTTNHNISYPGSWFTTAIEFDYRTPQVEEAIGPNFSQIW